MEDIKQNIIDRFMDNPLRGLILLDKLGIKLEPL
jgi:hypothetical protein